MLCAKILSCSFFFSSRASSFVVCLGREKGVEYLPCHAPLRPKTREKLPLNLHRAVRRYNTQWTGYIPRLKKISITRTLFSTLSIFVRSFACSSQGDSLLTIPAEIHNVNASPHTLGLLPLFGGVQDPGATALPPQGANST